MVSLEENASDREDSLIAQAAEWLVRLDSGSASVAEFTAWRDADPRRAAAFAQVALAWEQTARLRTLPIPPKMPNSTVAQAEAETPPAVGRRHFLKTALAAGAGVVAIGAGGFLLRDPREIISTSVGERRTLRLPDDTSIELNTDTRVAWDFGGQRRLWVERGEAALTVMPDSVRPFILHIGTLEAALTQGRYNARLHEAGPQLVALEGRGDVKGRKGLHADLAPMQAVRQTRAGLATNPVSLNEVQAVSAWRRGEILFRGTRLEQAVAEFNRYLTHQFVIADPSIRSVRLGGRFFVDDPRGFIAALEQGFHIRARTVGGVIQLLGQA